MSEIDDVINEEIVRLNVKISKIKQNINSLLLNKDNIGSKEEKSKLNQDLKGLFGINYPGKHSEISNKS